MSNIKRLTQQEQDSLTQYISEYQREFMPDFIEGTVMYYDKDETCFGVDLYTSDMFLDVHNLLEKFYKYTRELNSFILRIYPQEQFKVTGFYQFDFQFLRGMESCTVEIEEFLRDQKRNSGS